ncbi:MAG TPA: MmgE/PrpD family protein [Casimicrobiaceae bacterium]|nr:MmgE/PrpD family protein [Casimicrobiaceae bacterium]
MNSASLRVTGGADASAPPVTSRLADFIVGHPSAKWPADVEREAQRTLLNWLGCAIGASRHAAVDAALAAAREFGPSAQATVLGRTDRVDIGSAALINGIASHLFDFDDTHLRTIIHPAGPVASAALALAEHGGMSGRALLDALVIGVDVECRVGNAIYPDHYDRGWHITGSTGMLGAAAACARLLGLDATRSTMALGIAASQPVGVREQFGSMTKSLHPGAAARVGLTAALMAKHGYTASERALEAPRGLMQTYSAKCDWREIDAALGERFEIATNTYKPFACGIVIHPSIDGCIQLRDELKLAPELIERVELRVHPLVLELTGKRTPRSGLEGKFSVYHACAVAFVFGMAGEPQFSDACVADARVTGVRDRVTAHADTTIDEAAADITLTLHDGRHVHRRIDHAIGSLERPLCDAALRDKFHRLVDPILGAGAADAVIAACADLARADSVKALVTAARPRAT